MKTVKELDAGPILGAVKVPVAQDDNVGHLHDELAEEGARLLARLLPAYMAGELTPFAQPCDGITYANRILREDEWLDFTRRAEEVHNQIRGLSPNPGASTLFEGQTFKVFMSRLNPMDGRSNPQSGLSNDEVPGTCMETPAGGLIVRTGDGWLEVLEVQPAGKRRMSAIDWFRGQRGCKVILKSPELVQ